MTIVKTVEKDIPDGFPIGGLKIIDSSKPLEINIKRRAVRMTGNAYDITRIRAACDRALKEIEHKHLDAHADHVVFVHSPADDES